MRAPPPLGARRGEVQDRRPTKEIATEARIIFVAFGGRWLHPGVPRPIPKLRVPGDPRPRGAKDVATASISTFSFRVRCFQGRDFQVTRAAEGLIRPYKAFQKALKSLIRP